MDNDKAKTTSLRAGEDPVVIKIARLALILADKDYDTGTKQLCIKAAERMGYITAEESALFNLLRMELEASDDSDEEELS